ncbi:MAG: hypothetical protein K5669_05920 [Lachnospiraceae bacterium]|nr:hypothetical protein [Lachnospiraceae bacterium]
MSHGWQGGSIAVYGGQSLYKVEAVTAPSLLKRTNEDGRQGSRGDLNRDGTEEKKSGGFAQMLVDASDKTEESRNVRIRTTGYTKFGVPSEFYLKMRDYTYQK